MPRKHWYHKIIAAAWIKCGCGGMSFVDGTLKCMARTRTGPPCGHCKQPLDLTAVAAAADRHLELNRQYGQRN